MSPDPDEAIRATVPCKLWQFLRYDAKKPPASESGRKIEISATISEDIADAFEKQKALPKEGSLVVLREVAGAGFEPATFGL
jgi:hypothetical protein